MTENRAKNKDRFIPFRKRDVVNMCLKSPHLVGNVELFKQFSTMVSHTFHHEFHQTIESLKDHYAAIDPDADTRLIENIAAPSDSDFVTLLAQLLNQANYEQITEFDLKQAMTESSLFKIRLEVNFDDFSEVLLFCRGVSKKQQTITSFMGLWSNSVNFINYDRVLVYIRFKTDLQSTDNPLPHCRAGSTLLKLFQNVPKADLEMLFPNTQVRMRLVDKLFIGIPALVSGGIVLTTKLGASLLLIGSLIGYWLGFNNQPVELNKTTTMVLLAGIGALAGYVWKQVNSFKNRKLRFMQALTQDLYFKNLDNNAGVFHRLANDAEEEECKEAILAYYFLLISTTPLTSKALDDNIEQWFAKEWQCSLDFEIDDALKKLLTLDLVVESPQGFSARTLADAIKKLDKRWDDYFIIEETRE